MIKSKVFDRYRISMEKVKSLIIQSIVEVYGQKHRNQIEEALNNTYINSYVTAKDIENDFYKRQSKFSEMLGIKFLKKIGIKIQREEEEKVYKNGTYNLSDENKKILKIFFQENQFSSYGKLFAFDDELLRSEEEYIKKKAVQDRCDVLRKMGLEISPENYYEVIQTQNGKEILGRAYKAYEVAKECDREYKQFREENKDYIEYMDAISNYKRELNFKYLKIYAKRILPYVDPSDGMNIKKALEIDQKDGYQFVMDADKEKNT